MTGLEKMISQIVDEATESAREMTAQAEAEAAKIAQAAEADVQKQKEELSKKSQADTEAYMERIKSSADLQRRTAILRAKQDVIAQVLEKAYASLQSMDEDAYFDMLRKMLRKFVQQEEGEIYFSAADLERMPKSFQADINTIAKEKGGALKLAKESRQIENGFILVYGGVEENCTFRALFNTQRDRLQDIIHEKLFS
ncbi:MAG: hypothetical protein HFI31_13235 [Lachnospiraceae bacterium]|jgi:V/A-type H+-transporting ATPase subunit E|nr:hypothetical protein [Lachnospiraceae bacterium]MCI8996397.1 hypothetical protein [Lachnospiraceae bacterium]MCI9135127.1 hypothetical protein [Lachnospiraceae bacterium]